VLGANAPDVGGQAQQGDQKADSSSQQPARFRVEANFVRVDAYPLKDGKPLLGLKAEDFEVFEDGTAQRIETFEHVIVRPAEPGQQIDPGNQRAALQAVANPRNRVFVIFLDTTHVFTESGNAINKPLITLINRILGPDDLVGIMTPEMSASQVVFGRKTQVIQDGLEKNEPWIEKFLQGKDKREESYDSCYPQVQYGSMAEELTLRKRERATLEALQDLVRYLRSLREERKAIITVTQGWLLFGENRSLLNSRGAGDVPTVDPVGVGPNGILTTKDPRRRPDDFLARSECDGDRLRLATMDNKQFFIDIMNEANRANASFYPIDPRGLAALDSRVISNTPLGVDMTRLRTRIENLQTLAGNTDGIAVVNTNDLDKGVRRISDDLTSYYLLGYYSTNSNLDGRFRSLKVRVKQPGVDVRARRGYRAATAEEVNAARAAADAPVPDATRAVRAALGRLDGFRPEARFRINATSGSASRTVWVAGELQSAGRPDEFAQGAIADIEVMSGTNSAGTTRVTLKPGERTFLAAVSLSREVAGDIDVRARLAPVEGTPLPLADGVRLTSDTAVRPLYFRRGPTTGNRWLPAADLRFSRTERVRIEIPVGAPDVKPGAGRTLDRTGQPLQVPVLVAERTDPASGQRWITAEVTLAAFAAGDYAVEVALEGAAAGSERVITGVRVVR
jgi:VWFA-related protein